MPHAPLFSRAETLGERHIIHIITYAGCFIALVLALAWLGLQARTLYRKRKYRPAFRRIAARRHRGSVHLFFVKEGLWQPRLQPRGESRSIAVAFNALGACAPAGYRLWATPAHTHSIRVAA